MNKSNDCYKENRFSVLRLVWFIQLIFMLLVVISLKQVTSASAVENIKLNGPLMSNGYVLNFSISADSSRVVYRADQDTDNVTELYSSSLDICVPEEEICNDADDDCDGLVDEDFGVGSACDGIGECGSGVIECADLSTTRCSTDPGGGED